MPQPLSKVHPTAGIDNAPNGIMSKPDLVALVAHAITIGSDAELQWPMIAAAIDHVSSPKSLVAIHSALTSSDARRAMVRAIAEIRLNADDKLLFDAVERATKPARDIRNRFAHHIWGISALIPDALMLTEPTALAGFAVGFVGADAYKYGPPPNLDRADVMVYRKNDLEQARDTVLESWFMVHELRGTFDSAWPDEHRAHKRSALLNRPAVAQALQTLSRKTTQ